MTSEARSSEQDSSFTFSSALVCPLPVAAEVVAQGASQTKMLPDDKNGGIHNQESSREDMEKPRGGELPPPSKQAIKLAIDKWVQLGQPNQEYYEQELDLASASLMVLPPLPPLEPPVRPPMSVLMPPMSPNSSPSAAPDACSEGANKRASLLSLGNKSMQKLTPRRTPRRTPRPCTPRVVSQHNASTKDQVVPTIEGAGSDIWLNVYDLSKTIGWMNDAFLRKFQLGIFHCGVEVHGKEYFFGSNAKGSSSENPKTSGIGKGVPRSRLINVYRESVWMGHTALSPNQISRIVYKLGKEWRLETYHITHQNCHSFAEAFVKVLGSDVDFPSWIKKASDVSRSNWGVSVFADADTYLRHQEWWRKGMPGLPALPIAGSCCKASVDIDSVAEDFIEITRTVPPELELPPEFEIKDIYVQDALISTDSGPQDRREGLKAEDRQLLRCASL